MFPKKKALEIIEDFCRGNDDGTGSVYVKDGKFIVNKWNASFEEVVKRGLPLLDHMPFNGWTLAHVRAASHGAVTYNNTHPFVKGDFAMVHNGIFQEYAPVRAALAVDHTFRGQTDSEVAARLWQVVGRKNFIKTVDTGVYMFLKRNGRVDVICKSGGDLVYQNTKYGTVMASSLPLSYKRTLSILEGDLKLGKNGKIINSNLEKDPASNWNWTYNPPEWVDSSYEESPPKKGKKKKRSRKIDDVWNFPEEEVFGASVDSADRELADKNGYIFIR